jgi:hypothetical protein
MSRLCAEVARDPRLLPYFVAILALAPATIIDLAGRQRDGLLRDSSHLRGEPSTQPLHVVFRDGRVFMD